MALDCRIIRDDNGNLKKVEAPNGEKSILFDKLKNFFGEKKALALYALTETEAFKNLMSYKRGVFLNEQKEKLNTLNIEPAEKEIINTLQDFENILKNRVWGMLTAQNPNAKQLSEKENYERNKQAEKWLINKGYIFKPIEGVYEQKEDSYFVPNLSFEDAVEFAKKFSQESVATNEGLVYQDGTFNPRQIGKESIGGSYDNYYSTIIIENKPVNFKVSYDFELNKLSKISPETSANYANLTEDEEGNFVFYHLGDRGYKAIKKGTGQNKTTSREEATAISRVGGLAMYYPADNVGESMISNNTKYLVKVPKEKVYDFNRDPLNLLPEAEALFRKEYPNQAFDANTQLAYLTKVANEKGYDAVVAQWDGTTRVQTTKELKPVDEKYLDGNTITKDFKPENKFISNKDKGWLTQEKVSQSQLLANVYEEISNIIGNDYSNPLYRLREMGAYKLGDKFAPFKTQQEITDAINKSNIPNNLKDNYFKALIAKDVEGFSYLPNNRFSKDLQKPIVQVGGAKVFAKKQVNATNDKPTGRIELDLITSENRGSGEAREDMKQFLQIMDANKQEVFLTVSPRDRETSFDRLVKFYESFGFRLEPSGIEMVRRPKKVIPPTEDKNGEAKADEVIKFSKTTDEKLSKEELIEAMDAAVSLGVETSEELLENLDFNEYEQMKVDMGKVERLKAKLKNTPFSVPLIEVEKTSKVNSFGKQIPQVKQPTLPVQTVDENGIIVDKLSDTKEVLQLTYPENKKDNLMPKLVGAIQKINNEIFNENTKLVYDVIQDIKEEALDFGVDLKDIENRVFPFQKLKDFLSALQEYTVNPTVEFAKVYDEFFNVEPLRAYKPTFSSEYSEYELYDKFNLIRVGDTYQKVETPKLEPSAERQAKIAQLQVDDFRTDVVKLEEMVYHKEQLGQPLKTLPFEEVEAVNLREVKKNPYLKVTAKGVNLINQDPLTLEKAMVYGYESQVKETVEKIETDYSVIEDVLVTDLNNKSKVRTPLGVYTKIMDFQNKSIYTENLKNKTVNIKALLEKSDISPKIEAKKYYTKEEYDKNFGCL